MFRARVEAADGAVTGMARLAERLAAWLRGDRVHVPAETAERIRRAAEGAFSAHFPTRTARTSAIWKDEGSHYIVAVYQTNIRPSNAPTFFAVTKEGHGATFVEDQSRYRPRGLK